jgi:hypothetical protein
VQNCWINLDFDLFLRRKNGGLSPRAVNRARVASPWVHRGPHSGRRPELGLATVPGTAACRGGTGGKRAAREPQQWAHLGWRGGLAAVVLGVRDARGEESWGAWSGEVEAGGGHGRRGDERSVEVRFNGGELRGRLPGRGRGGGTD